MSDKSRFIIFSILYMLAPTLLSLAIGYVYFRKCSLEINLMILWTYLYEAMRGIILPLLSCSIIYLFLKSFFNIKKSQGKKFIIITALTGMITGLILEHLACHFFLLRIAQLDSILPYLWGMPWLWVIIIISTLASGRKCLKKEKKKG